MVHMNWCARDRLVHMCHADSRAMQTGANGDTHEQNLLVLHQFNILRIKERHRPKTRTYSSVLIWRMAFKYQNFLVRDEGNLKLSFAASVGIMFCCWKHNIIAVSKSRIALKSALRRFKWICFHFAKLSRFTFAFSFSARTHHASAQAELFSASTKA